MKVDERELDRIEAIMLSMTPEERRRPELIKGSRRLRIAKGSGTTVQQVNQLVKQFGQMQKVMKQIGRGRMPDLSALMRSSRADRDRGARSARLPALMAVRLRLTRIGGRKDPVWRVVVADQRSTARRPRDRDRRALQRADRPVDHQARRGSGPHWLARGAQPTDQVRKLLKIHTQASAEAPADAAAPATTA